MELLQLIDWALPTRMQENYERWPWTVRGTDSGRVTCVSLSCIHPDLRPSCLFFCAPNARGQALSFCPQGEENMMVVILVLVVSPNAFWTWETLVYFTRPAPERPLFTAKFCSSAPLNCFSSPVEFIVLKAHRLLLDQQLLPTSTGSVHHGLPCSSSDQRSYASSSRRHPKLR